MYDTLKCVDTDFMKCLDKMYKFTLLGIEIDEEGFKEWLKEKAESTIGQYISNAQDFVAENIKLGIMHASQPAHLAQKIKRKWRFYKSTHALNISGINSYLEYRNYECTNVEDMNDKELARMLKRIQTTQVNGRPHKKRKVEDISDFVGSTMG